MAQVLDVLTESRIQDLAPPTHILSMLDSGPGMDPGVIGTGETRSFLPLPTRFHV